MKNNSDSIWMLKLWAAIGFAAVVVSLVTYVQDQNTPDAKPTQTTRAWTVADSKAYAQLKVQDFADREFACLENLWGKESAWDSTAQNKRKVNGMKAGGIPQILGLDPKLKPAKQIDRGFKYIFHRYGTPCAAWKHWRSGNGSY